MQRHRLPAVSSAGAGVALTTAMRESVAGDTYSGLSRTAEAILIATGIALGAAVGLGIGYIL